MWCWGYITPFIVGLLKIAVELFDLENRQNHDFDIIRTRSTGGPKNISDRRRERHESMLDSMRIRAKVRRSRNKNLRYTLSVQVSGETTVHIGQIERKVRGYLINVKKCRSLQSRVESFVIRLRIGLSKLAAYQTSCETFHPPTEKVFFTGQRCGALALVEAGLRTFL
jgi:hypothetical protein